MPRFAPTITFILGFAGFSSVSNYITTTLLRSQIYVPELFIVPTIAGLYFSSEKSCRPKWTSNKLALIAAGIAFWILLIMLALDDGSLADALATGRGALYGFLAAFFAKCLKRADISLVVWFCVGALIGECLYAGYIAPILNENYRGITPINLVAVFVLASSSIAFGRPVIIVLAISLSVLVILLSGFRAPLAALIVGIVVTSVLVGMGRGLIGFLIAPIKATAVVALAIVMGAGLVTAIVDVDPYAYQRVVKRSIPLLQGDVQNTGDSYRLDKIYRYAFEEPGELAPAGFVGKARGLMGDMNDAAFLNFTLTLGVPIGVVVMLILISVGAVFFLSSLTGNVVRQFDFVAAAFFPFFLLILIINGRFAYIVYESIMVGLLIGYWFYFWRERFLSLIKANKSPLIRPALIKPRD